MGLKKKSRKKKTRISFYQGYFTGHDQAQIFVLFLLMALF